MKPKCPKCGNEVDLTIYQIGDNLYTCGCPKCQQRWTMIGNELGRIELPKRTNWRTGEIVGKASDEKPADS